MVLAELVGIVLSPDVQYRSAFIESQAIDAETMAIFVSVQWQDYITSGL